MSLSGIILAQDPVGGEMVGEVPYLQPGDLVMKDIVAETYRGQYIATAEDGGWSERCFFHAPTCTV